jgi:hypothetical protein
MINDLISKFKNFHNSSSYTRVSAEHSIELYYGKDELFRYSLLLISNTKPNVLDSTKIINVDIRKREDDKWILKFSLNDERFLDVFCCFCSDIIESTTYIKDLVFGTNFICERYLKWQNLLKKQLLDILSIAEIKGLIGELYFLSKILAKKVGYEKAINAWTGPFMTIQDFYINNIWYEVKATTTGSENVKISSIEQLDCENLGNLVVINLNKTSSEDSNKINLNNIVNKIKIELDNYYLELKFTSILLEKGYIYNDKYDEINFRFDEITYFLINNEFPCIRRNAVPKSITNASYSISLAEIKNYEVENIL